MGGHLRGTCGSGTKGSSNCVLRGGFCMSVTRLPGVPEKLKAAVLAALALVVMFVCENHLNLAFAADKPATGIPASISAVPEEINEAQVPLAAQSPSLG